MLGRLQNEIVNLQKEDKSSAEKVNNMKENLINLRYKNRLNSDNDDISSHASPRVQLAAPKPIVNYAKLFGDAPDIEDDKVSQISRNI